MLGPLLLNRFCSHWGEAEEEEAEEEEEEEEEEVKEKNKQTAPGSPEEVRNQGVRCGGGSLRSDLCWKVEEEEEEEGRRRGRGEEEEEEEMGVW